MPCQQVVAVINYHYHVWTDAEYASRRDRHGLFTDHLFTANLYIQCIIWALSVRTVILSTLLMPAAMTGQNLLVLCGIVLCSTLGNYFDFIWTFLYISTRITGSDSSPLKCGLKPILNSMFIEQISNRFNSFHFKIFNRYINNIMQSSLLGNVKHHNICNNHTSNLALFPLTWQSLYKLNTIHRLILF